MVSKKKSNKIDTRVLNALENKENSNENKIIKRKISSRRTSRVPIINNKKYFKEKKVEIDNKNWSWAHSIMLLTVSLFGCILIYNTIITEIFSHSVTSREKRDIINKRLKKIRVKRSPIDYSYHCDEEKCLLPKCKCFDSNNPGSLETKEIPQFVLLSFDGPLTEKLIKHQERVINGVQSANGCPAAVTYFASDKNTDFYTLEKVYVNGDEIAYNLNATESNIVTPKMANSLKNLVESFTNIEQKEINGFRFIGKEKLKINIYHDICDLEYLYDSSYSTSPLNNYWPFTLDYGIPTELNQKKTVAGVYPGLWEIPIYELLNIDNSTFSVWEPNVDSNDSLLKILENNFLNNHYYSNRAPFTLTLTEEWLEQNKIETINNFLNWIVNNSDNDVYFITYSQLIKWMKKPIGLSLINKSNIFYCQHDRKMSCSSPNHCIYKSTSFNTCKECPIQNPYLETNLDNIPESSPECDKIVPEDGCGNGIWECGCKCLNSDNNLDGYCLDEYGKCTIAKVFKENIGYICE
ncbi:hypothetical protein BCR32DRAFT_292580 [Anaeromyces robustus]|uniref:Uncharacterized protein n=1 Tax=Anaeromyces robustus TaxID=1754192 RepID=A0A1Y1XB31_9FUNG|nr:hypothetical protein BCR32DRAFT_292580 [Anaeromyces robustus]|eukprot:ORX82564.1 hypothetical protein BCR32DRAFT_292580 [Anaeromyces robustus]